MSLRSKTARLVVLVCAAAFVPVLSAGHEAAAKWSGRRGGLHTERLSPKQLQVWRQIVAIVMAEDGNGHPLHPTLRRLWDAVDGSGHVVYVDMAERRPLSFYLGGRFAITEVDPLGMSHQAVLVLNVRGIDRVPTKPTVARTFGFMPFNDLGRIERYAEVLGHELAHAVWFFADPERPPLGQQLRDQARMVVAARLARPGREPRAWMEELDRLSHELEAPAEAAEEAIWEELRAGQRAQGEKSR
jgi:hypothetical protein